jgi:predicted Zn-dependent protease
MGKELSAVMSTVPEASSKLTVPSCSRPVRRVAAAAVGILASAIALATPAHAASVALVRDAEIEALLQDYARPIFRVAGIPAGSVEILLVPDPEFNAFVADSTHIFINTGAILATETPNELIGVIAHETGHLAGNHLAQMRAVIRNTRIAAAIASIIGIGAVAAGSASGVTDLSQAAPAIVTGAQSIGTRSILAYARAEEATADRAAVSYLEATNQSPEGMLDVFTRMAGEDMFLFRSVDPYSVSHPLPRERIAAIENLVAQSRFRGRTDPAALQLRHDLVRAKLSAFTETAQQTARRYPVGDTSLPARYAQAISMYRYGSIDQAIRMIDALIQASPSNAYFWELKGQALLERGRAREAIQPLRRAVELDSDSGLLKILLGHALVETGDASEAIRYLNQGLQADPNVPNGYRQLGRAYAMTGELGMAQLVTAEGLFTNGEYEEAKLQASRAQSKFNVGSPPWLRAEDILRYDPPDR